MKTRNCFTIIFTLMIMCFSLSTVSASTYSIDFDPNSTHTDKSLTVAGQTITYREYANIPYVKYPVDTTHEVMNIYVPLAYYSNGTINGYTKDTAPIFMPNGVGGYMAGTQKTPGSATDTSPNATFVALSKGYLVAAPAIRGSNSTVNGQYNGRAPSLIVDYKAAVRYLRYNDAKMPGNAEKIISNGISAGGALSTLIGATGNNQDYEPYLTALGAANVRDDIFAVSAYCPITNLDNADAAYEWLWNGMTGYNNMGVAGTLTNDQITASNELKAMFPAYLNSLGLRAKYGTPLTLDKNGNGPFREYVKSYLIASAQKALDSGTDLSSKTWVKISGKTVKDIDWDGYRNDIGRLKAAPSFDYFDVSAFENKEFGTVLDDGRHFTKFGYLHNTASTNSIADAQIVKMMNPMNYICTTGTTTAKYWRIRHGEADRDTSLAISVMLATKLQNNGIDVDYFMPWAIPHTGDYDLTDLFTWMDKVCKK
jgi:hypothetical protein